MKYTEETEAYLKAVKEKGFNIWAMLGLYKKRSKLKPDIPDQVVQAVCLEYMKLEGSIKHDFPYFLQVLTRKTREYFAQQNISEHAKIKKEPVKLKITIG